MSARRSQRRTRRAAKHACLVVCEGKTEKVFMHHLKHMYAPRGCGISVTLCNAGGGSPKNIIKTAWKQLRGDRSFTHCMIIMDTDCQWPNNLPRSMHHAKMYYAGCTPCVEGLFLAVLDHSGFYPPNSSAVDAKRLFHDHYLEKCAKMDAANYRDLLPKDVLEERRTVVSELNAILDFLEGHWT